MASAIASQYERGRYVRPDLEAAYKPGFSSNKLSGAQRSYTPKIYIKYVIICISNSSNYNRQIVTYGKRW